MSTEEYEFAIPFLQNRYKAQGLSLNQKQAKKVLQYEEEKDFFSDRFISNHMFFSEWEAWDFEKHTFRQILSSKKYEDYEKKLNEQISRYE